MAVQNLRIKDSISNALVENGALKVKIVGGTAYKEVDTFGDLPAASSASGEIYVVKTGSGIYVVNRKSAGLYLSNGTSWSRLGNIPAYFSDANFKIYNDADSTKKLDVDVSNITTGTTRTLTILDEDITLYNPTGEVKEILFATDNDNNSGNYRVRTVNGGGTFRVVFYIPTEADAIESIILAANVTTNGGDETFTIDTSYAADGESDTQHGESGVSLTRALGAAPKMVLINLYKTDAGSTLFANASAGDVCAAKITIPTSTQMGFMGGIVRYRKTS